MIEKQSRTVTDIRTHRLIYGCMGLGGGWDRQPYGPAEIDAAEAAIVAALEVGVTAFDHADIYRHGKSEAVFGEVLARTPGLRERILLQTKCGIHLPEGDRPGYYDLRGTHIRHSVEQSLTRLRTDVIDVLLLHRPDPLADPEDVAETLTALHREGLVRYFGVSNMAAAQIAYLQAHLDLPLIVNQLQMSLADRDWLEAGVLVNTPPAATLGFPLGTVERGLLDRVGVQAWGPLARGRFTGAAQTPAEHATTAHVAALAEQHDTTPETILLWWLQRHPARIVPVIGTSRPERIRACADAVRREPALTHEQWYELWLTARGEALP
ncbi:aldo/keto reductase [Micromonospora fiedleri]|uniref:Aldo/keto reductase n=1 Tax=Micromonospora fiedleri TaxID=1157498 RepID=A0ABS1UIW3_9ACTN|nr:MULTISPECIES: aldo/keto reductase [Micromonospora]MBL6276273.1 aldo/keto reductase [Micromonospora fiedleri]WSK40545.1 aldo/keto reductase [Micromonospora maris]